MKHNKNQLVNHVVEFKESSVLIGANVYISVEDAKGILEITEAQSVYGDPNMESRDRERYMESNSHNLEAMRGILRQLAKAVLYTGGNPTSADQLISKFALKNLVVGRDIDS